MTGRYPFHIGMQHVTTLMPGSTASIPMDVPTIAEVLKTAGYRTHMIGKWHLGYAAWKNTPLGRGFDSYQGYLQGGCDYYNKTVGVATLSDKVPLPSVITSGTTGFDFWQNRTVMWEEAATPSDPGPYSVDAYQREAKRILDNHDPLQPLFLYLAHQTLHEPLQYPPEPKYAYKCKHVPHTKVGPQSLDRHTLCAMMNRLDDAIEEFVGMLSAKGMWNNTLLWVTSDNGGMLPAGVGGAAGSTSSNYPLRSGKASLFQGGVRVPNFISGGFLPQSARNTTVTDLIQHVDIPVTLAALAGTSFYSTDGFNVWDTVAHGADSPRIEVPLNVDTSALTKAFGALTGKCCGGFGDFNALIQGRWKLISGWSGASDGWSSIVPYGVTPPNATQTFQIIDGSKVWLFDLQSDPEERENVATTHPLRVLAMQRRLEELADSKQGYVAPQNNLPHARAFPLVNNGTWAPFLRDDESEVESRILETVLI